MNFYAFAVILIYSSVSLCSGIVNAQSKSITQKTSLMGTVFTFTAVSQEEDQAYKAIFAAIDEAKRIEKLISSWNPHSQTSEINRHAGIQSVKVEAELFQLISRAIKVSVLTEGAFDISYASLDKLWTFDKQMESLPPDSLLKEAVRHIDYQKIQLSEADTSVFLLQKGMKIGFGGIGKGYAANRAKQIMVDMGIQNGLVNAGGDLFAWGNMENGKMWKIGIAHPRKKGEILAWIQLKDQAMVTSGDYERYAMIDGVRYAHILNPKTGYPVSNTMSVSILCPDAELADALSTAVFVLGPEKGMALINQLNGIECLIVNAEEKILTSNQMELSYEKP